MTVTEKQQYISTLKLAMRQAGYPIPRSITCDDAGRMFWNNQDCVIMASVFHYFDIWEFLVVNVTINVPIFRCAGVLRGSEWHV